MDENKVFEKNLHELKQEILRNYKGEFEMSWLSIGDQLRETRIRFRNNSDYEAFINAIDKDCEFEDATFNGYIYKIDTPQFNVADRSQYGNEFDFKHENIEYHGSNCFLLTGGHYFIKFINFFTGESYKQQYLDSLKNEKRRSNFLTMARIQPFCRANNINLGYFDGARLFLRSVTDGNQALFHNNHSCLIWKSQCVSFNQVKREFKKI